MALNIDEFSFAYTLMMVSERSSVAPIPKPMDETGQSRYEAIAEAYLGTRELPAFIGARRFGSGVHDFLCGTYSG